MSTLKIKDIQNSLLSKGFEAETGRKHIFYYFKIEGKKTSIRTYISHGEKEIYDVLISLMGKQTKLTKTEFIDLIKCPLTKDIYTELLINRGYIQI